MNLNKTTFFSLVNSFDSRVIYKDVKAPVWKNASMKINSGPKPLLILKLEFPIKKAKLKLSIIKSCTIIDFVFVVFIFACLFLSI